MPQPAPDDSTFWSHAERLLARPGVSRSTMMGFPCLRYHGDFFASWDPRNDALVVKLDKPTVAATIAAGGGEPFAPSGRQFREWVSIPSAKVESWDDQLDAAFDHSIARSATTRLH